MSKSPVTGYTIDQNDAVPLAGTEKIHQDHIIWLFASLQKVSYRDNVAF